MTSPMACSRLLLWSLVSWVSSQIITLPRSSLAYLVFSAAYGEQDLGPVLMGGADQRLDSVWIFQITQAAVRRRDGKGVTDVGHNAEVHG